MTSTLKIHGEFDFCREHRGMWAAPEALPRTTGGCERLPKRYREDRGMWAAPEALPRMLDVRGQAIPINYITYYCQLSLIIDYYYLELCIDPSWWKMITHAETGLMFATHHYSTQLSPRACCRKASTLGCRACKEEKHIETKTIFWEFTKIPEEARESFN